MNKHPAAVYQCFVESFSDGGIPVSDRKGLYPGEIHGTPAKFLDWENEHNEYSLGSSFYGGNLYGVDKAVNGYLPELGIDMLYLTPVFKAPSNHKYDTEDYEKIDPCFGGAEAFGKLADSCAKRKIDLILDGVFNHTGDTHPWFKKALAGEKLFEDYYIKNSDGYFIKWNAIETLPVLDHNNPEIRKYFYGPGDSIVNRYLEKGASGWRLDVAEKLGKDAIKGIKRRIKEDFPGRKLYGEVMDTYGKEWLGDGLLDGVMNYVFLGNTVNFLTGKIDGEEYLFELDKMYREYPAEGLFNSWNIISTHDTNRMIFETGGNQNLFKSAVALQFTYPGIPMIYNGDELGIVPGEKDINQRSGIDWKRTDMLGLKSGGPSKVTGTMDWNKVNEYSSFYHFYRHLIYLRKTAPALSEGDFIPLYSGKNIIAFARKKAQSIVLTIVNRGPVEEIVLKLPENVFGEIRILKNEHGPLRDIKITSPEINIRVETESSSILCG
ncbi:MAG: alpha-amylase family glycosyl hydrolase [Fibrobacterota bacterium]